MASKDRIDPAALLFAVVAAGFGPALEPGDWELMNTAVGLLVFIAALCFVSVNRNEELRWQDRLAVVCTLSIVAGVALAWPAQEIAQVDPDAAFMISLTVSFVVLLGVAALYEAQARIPKSTRN